MSDWWNMSEQVEEEYSDSRFSHRHFVVTSKHPKRNIRDYGRLFNDLNPEQLVAAKKLGVSPMSSREEIEKNSDKLVKLHNTHYYIIDRLSQSVPYLVPEAADFLTDLGKLMQEYNGSESRFVISSVLRTKADVKTLRRRNGNASENSCHCYGTTFDITYNRFDRRGKTTDGQLKLDLARALADMKDAGYCFVKYERKQPCFHVTVRPKR